MTKDGAPFASGSTAIFAFTPNDNGSYRVTLTVRSGTTTIGSDSKTITVTNVNESPTGVSLSASSVAENAIAAIIGNVAALGDPDAIGSHTFTVSDSRLEVVSGQLKLKNGTSLNFEAGASINLSISATDLAAC